MCVAAPCAGAPLEAYGKLPTIEQVAISADGTLIAMATTDGQTRRIGIETSADHKVLLFVNAGDQKVRNLLWAGDDHLIVSTSTTSGIMGALIRHSELLTATDINIAAKTQTPLLAHVAMSLNILEGPPFIRTVDGKPNLFVTGIKYTNGQPSVSLFRIDLATDTALVVTEGYEHTNGYVVSANGNPLAESEYDATTNGWTVKFWRGGAWAVAQSRTVGVDTPSLLGLGRDGNKALVGEWENGQLTLHELAPDGGLSELQPVADYSNVIHGEASNRFNGVWSLVGDNLRYDFFDPADQARWKMIEDAYPGQVVHRVCASNDGAKVVVLVDSPTDGPAYALVDLTTKHAEWLGDEYQGLSPADLSPVQSIKFKATDGLDLTAYLTLPQGRTPTKLPLVVVPHDGPAGRDWPGFDWWAQAMASRGYAVLEVNYRGSLGFGWPFLSAGFGEWGRKMQTDLSDGVRYLAAQGIIDPARVCIAGKGYGGYAALAGATLDTGVYRCAIDVGGQADLARFVEERKIREGYQGVELERYWDRYLGAKDLADPHLQAISPAEHADKVAIPILLIHGSDDTVVPSDQSQMMADALKRAGKPYDLVVLNHEDHWLSSGEGRLRMLQASMDFLLKNNPPD